MTDGKESVRRALRVEDVEMAICYQIMSVWDFSYAKRLEWEIFAAKHQECFDCHAPPNSPCVNLGDLRNRDELKRLTPRINKRPHDIRVDWTRLLNGLKQRDYYRPAIEAQVRKMAR